MSKRKRRDNNSISSVPSAEVLEFVLEGDRLGDSHTVLGDLKGNEDM